MLILGCTSAPDVADVRVAPRNSSAPRRSCMLELLRGMSTFTNMFACMDICPRFSTELLSCKCVRRGVSADHISIHMRRSLGQLQMFHSRAQPGHSRNFTITDSDNIRPPYPARRGFRTTCCETRQTEASPCGCCEPITCRTSAICTAQKCIICVKSIKVSALLAVLKPCFMPACLAGDPRAVLTPLHLCVTTNINSKHSLCMS